MYKEFTTKPNHYTIRRKSDLRKAQDILTQYLKDCDFFDENRDMTKEGHSFAHGSSFYDVFVRNGLLEQMYKTHYERIVFSKTFMKEIGFRTTKDDGKYGEAKCIRTNGMTKIAWNREGRSCTYFGDKLTPNISVEIRKDGGTRLAFNGYIFYENQLKDILKLTW